MNSYTIVIQKPDHHRSTTWSLYLLPAATSLLQMTLNAQLHRCTTLQCVYSIVTFYTQIGILEFHTNLPIIDVRWFTQVGERSNSHFENNLRLYSRSLGADATLYFKTLHGIPLHALLNKTVEFARGGEERLGNGCEHRAKEKMCYIAHRCVKCAATRSSSINSLALRAAHYLTAPLISSLYYSPGYHVGKLLAFCGP